MTKKKWWLTAGIVVLVLILAWAGFMAFHGIRLAQTARTLIATLPAEKTDIAGLKNDLTQMVEDLDAVHAGMQPLYPLLGAAQGLPGAGPSLGQVEPLLNMGWNLSKAGKLLFDTFEPVLQASPGNPTAIERLFQAVQANSAVFDQAARLVDQAALERQKINPALLPEAYRGYYQRLDALFPLLQFGLPAMRQLPGLMGADGPVNYLILAQNRDELRASGGFITGIGLARLENGKLAGFSLGDSYAVDDYNKDYPPAPAPLEKFMLSEYWLPRDANWSPDFPTAALQVQKLYTLSTGTQTQGVIAFNQLAVKAILEVTGPVKVAGYPDIVSASSVENFMRQSWAPDPQTGVTPQWWANRKKFMGDLGKEILARLLSGGDSKTGLALAKVGLELLQSGQLLVYINQPQIVDLLAKAGLDGGLQPGAGDYVYLVDSNLGFNKVDPLIQRELTYQVDLSRPAHPAATLQIKYQHTVSGAIPCKHEPTYGKGTYADMQTRCYWDYWRVYLPAGHRLTSSSFSPVSGSQLLNKTDWNGPVQLEPGEKGLNVAAGMMVLPTRSQQEVKLQFELAEGVLQKGPEGRWVYSLRIPKQPGLALLPVVVQVKLPQGAAPLPSQPGWVKGSDPTWTWSGKLTQTQDLRFEFCCAQ